MELISYIKADRGNATKLADSLGIQLSYLSQLASGYRTVTPFRALLIEQFTNGAVRCEDLRPDVNWSVLRKQPKRKPSPQPAVQGA